jgi:hypothetical membrane protein
MIARPDHRTPLEPRHLALAGVLAPLVLASAILIAGLTWDDFSHRTQNISDLGGTTAPYPLVLNTGLVVFGLLVAAFALGLRRSHLGRLAVSVGPLVGYFGVATVVQGFTPCTPACAEGTPADAVHGLAALTGFLAVAVAMLLLRRALRAEPGWRAYARFSGLAGLFTLLFLAAWFVAGAVDPEGLHAGTLQRLFVAAVLVWLGVTGARLLRSASEAHAVEAPTG